MSSPSPTTQGATAVPNLQEAYVSSANPDLPGQELPSRTTRAPATGGSEPASWLSDRQVVRIHAGELVQTIQAPTSRIQVRERKFDVRPRELHGEEREAMWRDVILAEAPEVEKYARKAGRTIPVAILDPT